MTIIVGCLGQKGGSGKSTTARLVSVGVIKAGATAGIADLDHTQKTALMWSAERERYRDEMAKAFERKKGRGPDPESVPRVPCQVYRDVGEALADAERFDFYVLDAPGRTGPEILQIARVANVVVIPCNPGADDMNPTIKVFNGLVKAGIPRSKLIVVLNHVGKGPEEAVARNWLREMGLQVLDLGLKEAVAYRSAMTAGLSPMEVKHEGLRLEAEAVVKDLVALIIKANGGQNERSEESGAAGNAQVSAA